MTPDVTTRPPEPARGDRPRDEKAHPDTDTATISQVRTSLIRALRASPQAVEPLCDALELLEDLQRRLETKSDPDSSDSPAESESRPPRRNGRVQEYVIQRTADGEFLTERRRTGSQPFRCPKDAYFAAAEVLAAAAEPLHFDELLDRLNETTRTRHADYRPRVCLRFWGQHALVRRSRMRYEATDRSTFVKDAKQAWDELARHV
jgi:hypothetical protein